MSLQKTPIQPEKSQILRVISASLGDQFFAANIGKTNAANELTEMVQEFNRTATENLITMRDYAEAHGFVWVNGNPHFVNLPATTLKVTL